MIGNIKMKNCRNIEEGIISIEEGKINIKYAINGTGKTTTSKAIKCAIDNTDTNELLKELLPFGENKIENIVASLENISLTSAKIFDEQYISQYLFQGSELIKNGFDIFVKNKKYEESIEKVNETLLELNKFKANGEIENEVFKIFREGLLEVTKLFKVNKDGQTLNKSLNSVKFVAQGNNIINIPEQFENFRVYIEAPKAVTWIDWHKKGREHLGENESCPYCAESFEESISKKEKLDELNKTYSKPSLSMHTQILENIEKLREYLTPQSCETLEKIVKNINGMDIEEENFICAIASESELLMSKLNRISDFSLYNLTESMDEERIINDKMIKKECYTHFKGEKTLDVINLINNELSKIKNEIRVVLIEMRIQNSQTQLMIKENSKKMNDFLSIAGYNYEFRINEIQNEYKICLVPNNIDSEITEVTKSLSYGEKNALALALFMFEAAHQEADLIILDDPISSFDEHKKYAIMDLMFSQKNAKTFNNFFGKTVVMMTHDFTPVIDLVYVLDRSYHGNVRAHFLENKDGILDEQEITKGDITPFSENYLNNISASADNLIKLIYLRRYFEIVKPPCNEEVYSILSSLLHLKAIPDYKKLDGDFEQLTPSEIEVGTNKIKEYIPDFDYEKLYDYMKKPQNLVDLYHSTLVNSEKMQIFRLITEKRKNSNVVLQKFVNEKYHVENESLYQLNSRKYELVPNYIIKEADRIVAEIQSEIPNC